MSVLDRILGGVSSIFLTQERIDLLKGDVKELMLEIRDHDRRLIRLETLVEMGLRRGGAPRIGDE